MLKKLWTWWTIWGWNDILCWAKNYFCVENWQHILISCKHCCLNWRSKVSVATNLQPKSCSLASLTITILCVTVTTFLTVHSNAWRELWQCVLHWILFLIFCSKSCNISSRDSVITRTCTKQIMWCLFEVPCPHAISFVDG